MKSLLVIALTFLVSICNASEQEKVKPLVAEPVEIVLVCPEGSKHEGEEVPKWVTNEEAIKFYCDSPEETEIAE